jgi:HEAT repeat protein
MITMVQLPAAVPSTADTGAVAPRSYLAEVRTRFWHNRAGMIAVSALVLLAVAALLALPAVGRAPAAPEEDASPEPPNPTVTAFLERCDTPDIIARDKVVSTYRDRVTPRDLPAVLKAARDKRPGVRWGAVYLFYKFKGQGDKVVPVLLERLRDEDPTVRRLAAGVARHFGAQAKQLVPALVKAMDDKDIAPEGQLSVSQYAAEALGVVGAGARPALPALMKKTRTGDRKMRGQAFWALGQIARADKGSRRKVLAFLEAALQDKKVENRLRALNGLDALGAQAKSTVPALRKLLRTRDVKDPKLAEEIRECVMAVFGRMGPAAADALPDLLAIAQDSKRSEMERRRAMVTLPSFGAKAKAALPVLSKLAVDLAGTPITLRAGGQNRADQARSASEGGVPLAGASGFEGFCPPALRPSGQTVGKALLDPAPPATG